ncbi:MAG: lysozyme [Cyanobacteria bacterium P01_F01_bin.150]
MLAADHLITSLATPKLAHQLQSSLNKVLPAHPLAEDGLFGGQTGRAMGEVFANGKLPSEWVQRLPATGAKMIALQTKLSINYSVKPDGVFGPQTGAALGKLIMDGHYVPRQRTNEKAIAILKEFEGNGLPNKPFAAYICPTGHPTIGWGHTKSVTRADVRNGKTISEADANKLLAKDLEFFESAVWSRLHYPIGSNMFSACVLLCYNIGAGGFGDSTVLREINNRNYREAAAAFELWNKGDQDGDGKLELVPGLARRRKAERSLFEEDL